MPVYIYDTKAMFPSKCQNCFFLDKSGKNISVFFHKTPKKICVKQNE